MNSENLESMGIIVLGMHRSGTSLLTKVLEMSGAWLGEKEDVSAKGPDNPTGFWEHGAVRSINQCLLEASGADWDSVLGFDLKKVPQSINQHLLDEAKEIVAHLQTHKVWAIKDPRLCLTLPWWQPIIGKVIVIYINRSPLDIARSLEVRNQMSCDTGIALWEYYSRCAAANSRDLPLIVVNYDQLVDDPEKAQASLVKSVLKAGKINLSKSTSQDLGQFTSGKLRHSFSDNQTTRKELSGDQWSLYEQIQSGNLPRSGIQEMSLKSKQELEGDENMAGIPTRKAAEQFSNVQAELVARLFTSVAQVKAIKEDYSKDLFDIHNTMGTFRNYQVQTEKELVGIGEKLTELKENFQLEHTKVNHGKIEKDVSNIGVELSNLKQELNFDMVNKNQNKTDQGILDLGKDLADLRTELNSNQISMDQKKIGRNVQRLCEELLDLRKDLKRANDPCSVQRELKQALDSSISELSQSESVIQSLSTENKVLSNWLSDTFDLTDVTFKSARWKMGDRLVRGAELAMFRKKPHLAVDVINELRQQFKSFRSKTGTQRSSNLLFPELGRDEFASGLETDSKASVSGRDIVIFPIIDWNFRIQRPQHLARELAQDGNRVFYLTLQPELGASQAGFEIVEKPCHRVHLVKLKLPTKTFPNVYTDFLENYHRDQLLDALGALITESNLSNMIALVDLPFWSPVASALPGTPLIYDCMDHHGGFSTATKDAERLENKLVEQCDLLIVTSLWLWDRYKDIPSKCLIPNAGEIEFFSKKPEHTIDLGDGPIVGYVGAIADWFDVELVVKAAVSRPDIKFVLVGSTAFCDTAPLNKLENIKLVGEVPYSEVPGYVHAFDCCFIPFQLTELIKATNPVKIYEYLAAGKPVVSTNLPELEPMSGLLHLAKTPDEFVSSIDLALDESKDKALAEQRTAWASQHDWSHRKDTLLNELGNIFPRVSVIVLCYNNLEYTKSCLKSLLGVGSYPDIEIIMVDNGSTDGTHEYLQGLELEPDNFKVITNSENLGFSAGNNVGIKAAEGDYIVLLNNDTFTTPGWIFGLVRHLRRDPGIGLVGPVTNNIGNEAKIEIHYADMESMILSSFDYTRSHTDKLLFVPTVAFFCVAFTKELIDKVGLLDEQFGQGFFEDDDYCRRVSDAGYQVAIAEDVFVHHHLSATFSKENKGKRDKLFATNKKKYEAKWGKWKAHEYR